MREIGPELWAVETRLRFLGVQAGRRMAVVRLTGGELLVHSPAPLTADLRAGLDALGPVRYVVPASHLHGHVFMEQYQAAYPDSKLFAAPGLREKRDELRFAGDLDAPDPPWSSDLDQATFDGHGFLEETVFLHRASATLLVGDVVWNVGPGMPLTARLWGGWRSGVRPTPAFRRSVRDRGAARRSVQRILDWDFDRILIGHGAMVDTGGREAFRRAYAWL